MSEGGKLTDPPNSERDDGKSGSLPKGIREALGEIPLLENCEVLPIPVHEQVLYGRLVLLQLEGRPSVQFAVSEAMFQDLVEQFQKSLGENPSWVDE